jgi:hypothetical protein
MQKISSVEELRNAIQLLEAEKSVKGELLKKQVMITYESLRPVNLIKNTLKDLFSSSFRGENISGIAAGITGGYLLKNIFVGRSGNPFKKILGSFIQYGLTNIIAQNSQLIRSFADGIFRLFSEKRK